MKHKPLNRLVLDWCQVPSGAVHRALAEAGSTSVIVAGANVSDGSLRVIRSNDPGIGWHLSISFLGRELRYPTWDEQVAAVRRWLPPELTYAMFLPPDAEYVAVHDTTFHWHECAADEVDGAAS